MTPDDHTRSVPPADTTQTHNPSEAALDAGIAAAFGSPDTRSYHAAEPETGALLAGKYRLAERIGEGGMGSVWVAHQTEPVKRKVAVKLIKAGMDSKAVLARFEAERQALAVMDHPNIAKVLDGGLHDRRPFFVMELVKGVPITQFCDERKLTPAQRLELFVTVCQALQHAHQKGVIHRDIKPSNVLVALYDDKPVPKVIDFGIAKATGGTLTDKTIETAFGGVVGTPQYMSPEQASLNNLDIDTRSDVYSLGVLLYELLTGSPPFARKELEKRGLLEILRVVREEEPPRPSVKLSTADALPSLSASRGTEPKKLTGLLRNELDWIVMKALEKDRTRRYETANGFAMDVTRYLSGDAVQAHPPSTAYRLRKIVRRNKVQVIAASLVLFALVAGITGTMWGMVRAEEERDQANQARQREQERADGERKAKEVAEADKQRADGHRDVALKSLRVATAKVVLVGKTRTLAAVEKEQAESLLAAWEDLSKREGESESARAIRGEGLVWSARLYDQLRRADDARRQYEAATHLHQQLANEFPTSPNYRQRLGEVQFALGLTDWEQGNQRDGEKHCLDAVANFARLAAESPEVAEHQRELAKFHGRLGFLYFGEGKWGDAESHYRQAISHQEKLADDGRDEIQHRYNLAGLITDLGRTVCARGEPHEGLKWFTAAIDKVSPDAHLRPGGQMLLGNLHAHRASAKEQLDRYVDAIRDWNKAVELNPPPSLRHRARWAIARMKVGQTTEAVTSVDELMKGVSIRSPLDCYDFGCAYAVASSQLADKKREYADRSIALLRRAAETGWKNHQRMKTDEDLTSLRERDDFKKLIADLEAKFPPKSDVLPPRK